MTLCGPVSPGIRYGDLNLNEPPFYWPQGSDLGVPEVVKQALQQQLQDGETVSSDRASNRTLNLPVMIRDDDLLLCAQAEAQLALEAAKAQNTLTFDPGDGSAPLTIFDTFVGTVAFDRDDDRELVGVREYTLELPALPYARSADLVTTTMPAPPASVTTATVDNGSSTTGWTGSGTVSTVSGRVETSGQQRTNLIGNPSAEANSSGWFPYSSDMSVSRTGGSVYVGSYMFRLVTVTGPTGGQVWAYSAPMSVTAGLTYTAQAHVKAYSTQRSMLVVIRWYTGSGALISGSASSTVLDNTSTWQQVSVTGTAPAGAVQARLYIGYLPGEAPPGETHFIDGVLFEQSASVGTYFDGSTTDAGGWDYAWTGSADTSPSTATVLTWLQRSSLAVSMSGTPYLRVVVGGGGGISSFEVNGTPVSVIAQSGNTYWLDTSAVATLNTFRVNFTSYSLGWVDDISRTNSLTVGTTGRQNTRQLEVLGSARSQASLSLADASAALGSALIYTTSDLSAHSPNLRQFLVAGPTVTADSTTVSGGTSPLTTTHNFDLPADGVPPGGYLLLARIKHASTASYTVSWSAASRMGSTAYGTQSGTKSVALTAGTYAIKTIALLNLPPARLGTDGIVRISLSSSDAITIDEAWLFNLDTGRLTWVECGTGTPAAGGPFNRLWLDTASVDNPAPTVWYGTEADRSDSVHAGSSVESWGVHEFTPPAVSVFSVTSGSTAADLILTYYPRWHTHAAL